jgi:hypothetical protein
MNAIESHANYDADDLAYLRAKGYSDAEIRGIWDRDARSGKGPCRWEHPTAQAKLHDVLNRD